MRWGRVVRVLVPVAVAVTALVGVPAAAAVPVPGDGEPSPDQARAALAAVQRVGARVEEQTVDVGRARAAVARSAEDAALALESYSQAVAVRDAAARAADVLEQGLVRTQREVDEARAGLAGWVRRDYLVGGRVGLSPGVTAVLSDAPFEDLVAVRVGLERAGAGRIAALARLRAALDVQAGRSDRARQVADVAAAASAQAFAASRARDAAVARHRAQLADLETLLASSRAVAARARSRLEASRWGVSWGGLSRGVDGGSAGGSGGGAGCVGGDTSGYANGRIPVAVLCPLWGASGVLRADAAAAFTRMSREYAAGEGRPLCVRDAYRSFGEQVRVRAERGSWAAVPGRSTHGLGVAVDLCGGVEDFDAPAYGWMVVHAPVFGWFHPAWARRGGSLPEPWHWEFGGQAA